MKTIVIIALSLALGACGFTPWGNAARQGIRAGGAQVMDEGIKNAEWVLCKESSIGSIQRRYGVSKDKADAWRVICTTDSAVTVIGPD